MLILSRALTVPLVLCCAAECLGLDPAAHFWLSNSNRQTAGPEAPTIYIGDGARGTFYIWARPRELDTNVYDKLANFSLNLVSEGVDTGVPEISFLEDQITVFNDELHQPRFEYDRDSTPQYCDSGDDTFVCVPQIALPANDAVLNLAGFSIDPAKSADYPGIGGDSCDEADLCFTASDGKSAWLLAGVGYRTVSEGSHDLYLQIGSLGMNYEGMHSSQTDVQFGDDPGLFNAATNRKEDPNISPADRTNSDGTISSTLAGDFNMDGKVNGDDLEDWQTNYGLSDLALPGGDGNGVVDGGDFVVWQQYFGTVVTIVAAEFPVPELETAVGLLALVGLATALPLRIRSLSASHVARIVERDDSVAIIPEI